MGNFVAGASVAWQIYKKDFQALSLSPTTVSSIDSTQANQAAYQDNYGAQAAGITPDGRYVIFTSGATNGVMGSSNINIWRKDLANPTIAPKLLSTLNVQASNQSGLTGDGDSGTPQITDDGRYVIFASFPSNFVFGALGYQVCLKDLSLGF